MNGERLVFLRLWFHISFGETLEVCSSPGDGNLLCRNYPDWIRKGIKLMTQLDVQGVAFSFWPGQAWTCWEWVNCARKDSRLWLFACYHIFETSGWKHFYFQITSGLKWVTLHTLNSGLTWQMFHGCGGGVWSFLQNLFCSGGGYVLLFLGGGSWSPSSLEGVMFSKLCSPNQLMGTLHPVSLLLVLVVSPSWMGPHPTARHGHAAFMLTHSCFW